MNRVLVVFSDGLLSELDSARGLVSRSAWIRQAVEDKLMKEAVAPLVPEVPKRVWKGTAAEWAAFQEGAGFETPDARKVPSIAWTEDAKEILEGGFTPNEFDAHKAKPKRPFRCPDCLDPTPHERGDCPGYLSENEQARREIEGTPWLKEAIQQAHDDGLLTKGPTPYAAEPKPKARRKKDQVGCPDHGIIGPCPECDPYIFARGRPPELSKDARAKRNTGSPLELLESRSGTDKMIVSQRCNRGACTGTINPVKGRCVRCNQTPLKESK